MKTRILIMILGSMALLAGYCMGRGLVERYYATQVQQTYDLLIEGCHEAVR
jgi:hypothetical protein